MFDKRQFRAWPAAPIILMALFFALAPVVGAQVPFRIDIGSAEDVARGTEIIIPVTKTMGSEPMTGFDLLILYDYSALTLLDVEPGVIFDAVGDFRWESLDYQQETFVSAVLDSTYPPRSNRALRIAATADIENGGLHPLDYQIPDGTVMSEPGFNDPDRPFPPDSRLDMCAHRQTDGDLFAVAVLFGFPEKAVGNDLDGSEIDTRCAVENHPQR